MFQIALMVFSTSLAADPCVSGVPVGKRPGPYSFLVATGPQSGQQTCYICDQEDKPAVVVFTRKLDEPLAKLLLQLDGEVAKKKGSGFKVWMTQLTPKADLDSLSNWSKKQGLKSIPLGAFEDVDGPPAYKLNVDAEVTVLLFVKKKVVANFAFRDGELKDENAKKVMEELPKLFEGK